MVKSLRSVTFEGVFKEESLANWLIEENPFIGLFLKLELNFKIAIIVFRTLFCLVLAIALPPFV